MFNNKTFRFLFVFSILVNVLVLLLLFLPSVTREYYKTKFTPIEYSDINECKEKISKSTILMLKDNKSVDQSVIYCKSFSDYLAYFQSINLNTAYEYGEFGFFCHYLYKYATNTNNNKLHEEIRRIIDEDVLRGGDSFPLKRTDQIAFGCILLDLYNDYKDSKYLNIIQGFIKYLQNIESNYGIIMYNDSVIQNVDGIGLICPFLNQYYKAFNDSIARRMSSNLIIEYLKNGVDERTGLPAQAYNRINNNKHGFSSWGRGAGWLALGLLEWEGYNDDQQVSIIISHFDNSIVSMAPLFHQYLSDLRSTTIDTSATIMLLYYLKEKKLINMPIEEILNIMLPFIDADGVIRFSSPSISRPFETPNCYQKHHLSQALFLYMLSYME